MAEHWLWAKCTSWKCCCCGKAKEDRANDEFEQRRKAEGLEATCIAPEAEKTLAEKAADAEALAAAHVGSNSGMAQEAWLQP